jgi:hypothetical protein
MAEIQWWLLIVGLVAGGGLVAVVSMDARRREEDLSELERRAEATWIAEQLSYRDRALDPHTVESVLRAHREYLSLPPPDRLVVEDEPDLDGDRDLEGQPDLDRDLALDGDADRSPDDVRDDGRGRTDEDLARAAEQRTAARQQAHAGADREQRPD